MRYEELFKVYNTKFETLEKMMEIFFQGDFRYLHIENEIAVSGFVDNKAISIEKEFIKETEIRKSKMKIKGPQKDIKQIAVGLLKKRGFKIEGFEMRIPGGIVDVLGKKEKQQIAMECGPCRIDKAIDYLEITNTELWILTRKDKNSEHVLYKIKKDKNWDEFLNFHKKYKMKSLKEAVHEAFKDWDEKLKIVSLQAYIGSKKDAV